MGAEVVRTKAGFHLVIRWSSLIVSILALLGYLVLMQQYGAAPLTTGNLLMFLVLGVLVGILIPTLATLIPKKQKPTPDAASHTGGDAQ